MTREKAIAEFEKVEAIYITIEDVGRSRITPTYKQFWGRLPYFRIWAKMKDKPGPHEVVWKGHPYFSKKKRAYAIDTRADWWPRVLMEVFFSPYSPEEMEKLQAVLEKIFVL